MEANQNPPSDREWTIAEMEEFFANSYDAIVGSLNNPDAHFGVVNGSSIVWSNAPKPIGIHITSIVPPERGWPVAYYCPLCKKTTFLLETYAIKPVDGDYWRMNEVCADDELRATHNMWLATNEKISKYRKEIWK